MYVSQLLILVCANILLALATYIMLASGRLIVCTSVFAAFGGVVAAELHNHGVPLGIAILAGGISGGASGCVLGILCSRLTGFRFAIVTLALAEIARSWVSSIEWLGGALGYRDITPDIDPATAALVMLFGVGLLLAVRHSELWWAFGLFRENETLAAGLGVNRTLHAGLAMAFAGIFAGMGGGIYAHAVGIIEPAHWGADRGVEALMFTVIGGFGTVWSPVAGATILTLLPEGLRFSNSLRLVLYGAILVLTVTTCPTGIANRIGEYRRRRRGTSVPNPQFLEVK